MTDLSAVFRPRAIAVVGASDDPVKIGGRPLAFLLRHGYAGRVFPVNPARATVQGLPAFPSIGAIPEEVDLAIVVVPAERVLESLEEAAAKGVRAAIVFSSGFEPVNESRVASWCAAVPSPGVRRARIPNGGDPRAGLAPCRHPAAGRARPAGAGLRAERRRGPQPHGPQQVVREREPQQHRADLPEPADE